MTDALVLSAQPLEDDGIGTTITVSLPRRAQTVAGSRLPVASAASR